MTGPRRRPGRPPNAAAAYQATPSNPPVAPITKRDFEAEARVSGESSPATEQPVMPPPPVDLTKALTHPPKADKSEPRRRRASVGGHSLKLTAPARKGQNRRWFNEDGNRLADAKELGYEFVSETGLKTSDPGSRVSRLVGTKANGEPLHAYLMETPDELYAEGVAEKEAANRLIDEAITAGRDSTGRIGDTQYGHGSITTDR